MATDSGKDRTADFDIAPTPTELGLLASLRASPECVNLNLSNSRRRARVDTR